MALEIELRRFEHNLSCLSCDKIKKDMLMMVCGHNICTVCLAVYSHSHTRSAIRCEVCTIESKVLQLKVSMPNRALTDAFTAAKSLIDNLVE